MRKLPSGEHRRLAHGLLQVVLFGLVAKSASGLKEIVTASRYGTSGVLDGYLLVFEMTFWMSGLLFAVATFVLTPIAVRLRTESPAHFARFQSEYAGGALIAGAALACLLFVGLPLILEARWFDLSAGVRASALYCVRWLPWLVIASLLAGVYSIWLIARERHWNTLLDGMPALGIAIVVGLWAIDDPRPLVWGTVLGFTLQAVLLGWIEKRNGGVVHPSFRFDKDLWRLSLQGFSYIALAQGVLSVANLVDTLLAARLGETALSTYTYAARLNALLLGISATALGRACLPVFTTILIEREPAIARKIVDRWVQIAFFGGLAILLISVPAAPFAVKLVFERGAFTQEDTFAVSTVLRWMLAQAPFYLAWIVLQTLTVCLSNYRVLIRTCILALVLKLVAAGALSAQAGLAGIAFASTLMYSAVVGYTWWSLRGETLGVGQKACAESSGTGNLRDKSSQP